MLSLSKRAVLFDLDGTLRHNDPPQIDTFFTFARELGLDVTPEQARETTRWIHAYWADSEELKEDRTLRGDNWESSVVGFRGPTAGHFWACRLRTPAAWRKPSSSA